jgi:hypothetical protein
MGVAANVRKQQAVEKLFSTAFPSSRPCFNRAGAGSNGNPGFSGLLDPRFHGMTNYASRDDFFNSLTRPDPMMF